MVSLWTLLLFFKVRWWIILLTIITPAIILARWLWYWTHLTEIIPAAGDAGDVVVVGVEFITPQNQNLINSVNFYEIRI